MECRVRGMDFTVERVYNTQGRGFEVGRIWFGQCKGTSWQNSNLDVLLADKKYDFSLIIRSYWWENGYSKYKFDP